MLKTMFVHTAVANPIVSSGLHLLHAANTAVLVPLDGAVLTVAFTTGSARPILLAMFSHEDFTVLHCMSKFSPSNFKIQYKMFTCQELFFQVSFHFNRCRTTVNTSLRFCHSLKGFCPAPIPSSSASPLPLSAARAENVLVPLAALWPPEFTPQVRPPSGKANNPIFNKSRLRNLSSESAFLVLCISSYLRDAQPWSTDRLGDAGRKII